MKINLLIKLKNKASTALWLLSRGDSLLARLKLYISFRRQDWRWRKKQNWDHRIKDALASSDNNFIPRVEDAGKILGGELIMHNGLRVGELSYDGEGPRNLMILNRGVHEPQEERLFQEVLITIPEGGTMIELGSYWAFYSMWFYRKVKNANCICVEPDKNNIEMGIENFKRNFGMYPPRVVFENAFAGASNCSTSDVKMISVDSLLSKYSISKLSVLHADTQGAELDVLYGSHQALSQSRIDYIFLSTHTNELHRKCTAILESFDYEIIADIDLLETYSFDGLIVAKRKEIYLEPVLLSRKGLKSTNPPILGKP